MKILIATDTYYPNVNGASYFSQRLASYLVKRGHSVLVMAPSRSTRSYFYEHEGAPVFGIRSVPIFLYQDFRVSPPGFKRTVKRVVKEFSPDVVHLQNHFFIGRSALGVALQLGIPTLGTNHFMPENLSHYFHLPHRAELLLRQFGWRQFCSVFEKMDGVTTPTKTAAGLLKEIGFSKPVTAISNGIDLEKFSPSNQGEYLKQRFGLQDQPVLLFVGRLDKEKNIDLILRALSIVNQEIDVHFIIAGRGFEAENLKKLTKRLDLERNVTFTGFVSDEDLPNLYCAADCFIIAGTAELQSIATMEAMASGLPVIAVQATALPELVRHGENGYLFQLNDPLQVAKYIIEVMSDAARQRKMSERSLEIIKEHDINAAIDQFETLYQTLLNEKKSAQAQTLTD